MEHRPDLGFIVEGHCEYDGIPSFVGRILGHCNLPVHNAQGIGNILKNLDKEIIIFMKTYQPRRIIVTLDYREARRENFCIDCLDLKNQVRAKIEEFYTQQKNGSLILPDEVIVVIAYQTYDSWLCSDIEGLRSCELFDPAKLSENYDNVDEDIRNPSEWLKSKCKINIDLKNRRFRKKIASAIRPDIGQIHSRSFRKFIKELTNHAA
jgi:hypothetical protein